MILDKATDLFPVWLRKILMPVFMIASLICLFLVRYSPDGILKITWLYAMFVCIMFLVVLYKNSLNVYEITIFCFLGIQLLAVVPDPGNLRGATVSISYLLSYRYGVSSRSLIATAVDFFTRGGFVSRYFVWHFIFNSTIFLSFVISVYLGALIQKTKDATRYFSIFLSLLWLSCFTTPVTYFFHINFGRTEMFALPILFLAMVIVRKPVIRWLIPLLAIAIIATHLILVFFYIPFVIILLLYSILENDKKNKETVFLLIVTLKVILIAFFGYLIFSEDTFVFDNADVFYAYLLERTDLNINRDFLHSLMFASLEDHLVGWRERVNLRFHGNISIFINIPLITFFIVFWLKCFFGETKKTMKLFFLMPVLVLLYHAVAFFLFWDFSRWMIMILNVQFMLLFYLVSAKNTTVLSLVQRITPTIKRNAFFIALACLIMVFLGPMRNIGPSENTYRIFRILVHMLGL